MNPNATGPWQGQGQDFHAACDDAWKKAEKDRGAGTYKVQKTEIVCDNPIRSYIVTIAPS
jgi:hypothetical protein